METSTLDSRRFQSKEPDFKIAETLLPVTLHLEVLYLDRYDVNESSANCPNAIESVLPCYGHSKYAVFKL